MYYEDDEPSPAIYVRVADEAAGILRQLARTKHSFPEEMAGEAALHALEQHVGLRLDLWRPVSFRQITPDLRGGEPFDFMASDRIVRTARDIANNVYGPRAGAVSAADVIRRAVYHGSIALWMDERRNASQRTLNPRVDGDLSIAAGERVRHPKFGVGTVISIEPLVDDSKITIKFNNVGRKTLRLRFSKLTPA